MKKINKPKNKNQRETINTEEASLVFLHITKKLSESFYVFVKPEIENLGIKINKNSERNLIKEIVIICSWILTVELDSNRQLLDKIHTNWLTYRSTFINAETDNEALSFFRQKEKDLGGRYKEYSKKLYDKNGLILPQAMLINMLNKIASDEKLNDIKYDVWFLMNISSHVFEGMKIVRETYKDIKKYLK